MHYEDTLSYTDTDHLCTMWTHYHHLALGESVLVVEDVDSFIHSHQPHFGSRVSSDLQTEGLAGGVNCSRARGLHFQLKREKKRE